MVVWDLSNGLISGDAMGGTAVELDISGGLFTVQIIRGGKINTFRKL